MADLIDGKKISQEILAELKNSIIKNKLKPSLAIILVGSDPASLVYVNQKKKRGEAIGVKVTLYEFPEDVRQEELVKKIVELNNDSTVFGIIIQLPLPNQLDKNYLLNLINPKKDVDGLVADSPFEPATPLGIMELLKRTKVAIKNKQVTVMGASALVGKPVARLLEQSGGLVKIVDINTPNPEVITKQADILVVAIGKPLFVKKEMVKEGAVVIDVGTNRTEEGLVGDVDFENVEKVASLITPVPGGVGPMTVAMLLSNVTKASLSSLRLDS